MIRIDKIHLENFKGIEGEAIIDFQNFEQNYNILAGPNGFGKTTIFDALEICLTNSLRRVIEVFQETQQNNRNRSNNYLQNDPKKDLILKVLLVDTMQPENTVVLIKRFDVINGQKKNEAGREFIAWDTTNLFDSYFEKKKDIFKTTDFSTLTSISLKDYSKKVNDYLFQGDYNISGTYHLFNYIRQDDSINFLKIPEQRKGGELSFLFNTEKDENEKRRIDTLISNLDKQKEKIEGKIDELKIGYEEQAEDSKYINLFEGKEILFDIAEPFNSLTKPQLKPKLDSFIQEINDLVLFKTSFDLKEFDKYLRFQDLNKIKLNDAFMNTFLLSTFLTDKEYESISKEFEKQKKMRLFKERDDKLKVDVEFFEWFLLDSPENKINYQSAHSNINRLNEELGNTGKIISDLLEFRRNILKEFELLRAKESLQDNDRCPLCDSKFDTYDGLIQSIDLRTKKLEEFNRLRLEEVEKSKKTIESISSDIQKHIENYIKSNVQLIDALVQLLPNLQNSLSMVLGHIEKLPKEIVPDLQKYKFINFPKSHEELDNKRQELKNHVTTLTDENYKYIPEKIEGVSLFEKYFNSEKDQFEAVTIENLNEKKKFLYHVFKEESDEHLSFLKTRKEELNKIISSTEKVSEKLGQAILDYQKSIVNRIKVPFFIYSGKILQSYQQGSGIFISTEGTGKGTRIGFRTGVRSDHDIVYHLSAGQLSAVALAFILALNKVYGANKNFKFLAIDDPIQTMDDLNMHTFVELLRNDFSGYQILLSTHDDYVASYMKYKFEKEGINTEVTDVHEKLWSSSVS